MKTVTDESAKLGPMLYVNSTTSIYGESSILRHLNRLAKSPLESMASCDWMDNCTNLFVSQADKNAYMTHLSKYLVDTKSKFLSSNNKPELADYYNWSAIKSSSLKTSQPGVKEWMLRLEETDSIFKLVNKI